MAHRSRRACEWAGHLLLSAAKLSLGLISCACATGISNSNQALLAQLIVEAGDQVTTVGCDRHGIARAGMALERHRGFPCRQIPNAQRLIVGAGDHVATIGGHFVIIVEPVAVAE